MHVGVNPAGAQVVITRQIPLPMSANVFSQLPDRGNLAVQDRQIDQSVIRQSGASDY
ncbi:hypothetical protein D3C73_1615950 [compost metagenome]